MKLSVYRPQLDDDFKHKSLLSANKGAKVFSTTKEKQLFLTCVAYGRTLGKIEVSVTGDSAFIVDRHIIERDFYPYEAMIIRALSILRRRKVKTLAL